MTWPGDTISFDRMIVPNPARTVIRPFEPGYPSGFDRGNSRTAETIALILGLDEDELARQLDGVTASLKEHHRDVEKLLLRRFDELASAMAPAGKLARSQKLLIGACYCQEYAYEAAALFNPSVVPHPDQSGLTDGTLRFILSLRGIGEGHVSSVTFRTGTWAPGSAPTIDDPGTISVPPHARTDADNATAFRLDCGGSRGIAETVLYPLTLSQRQGIEDMRLVRFVDDDGSVVYHGTYTAFSGAAATSELLSTDDFVSFRMRPLIGTVASAKGMALFPRRIDGRYATLGRQDSRTIWLNASDDLLNWGDRGAIIVEPRFPWEYVQMGNCGSPIELDEGWLVMTHGVGTVRNYCIGACLLDKRDPSRLVARTPRPILAPSPAERDGYVPNVVYSCGALVKDRTMLLPYGVADSFSTFASLSVDELLASMV